MGKLIVKGILGIACIFLLDFATVWAGGSLNALPAGNVVVYYGGEEIPLADPLISIIKDDGYTAGMYMPLRELLEYLGYSVQWESGSNAIYLTANDKGHQGQFPGANAHSGQILTIETSANLKSNDALEHAAMIEVMVIFSEREDDWTLMTKEGALRELLLGYLRGHTYEEIQEIHAADELNSKINSLLREALADTSFEKLYVTALFLI